MITGSATGAGNLLHITQPAISQLLHQLENECGFSLFYRLHNGLRPTPEAKLLYKEVEGLMNTVERVQRVATKLKEGNWGAINVAGFPALAHRFLPEVVAKYKDTRPDITLSVESRRSRTLIDWVATQRVDVGIGLLASDRPDVSSTRLGSYPGVCVFLKDHRLARRKTVHARDLEGENFISLGTEDRSRLKIDKVFENERVHRRIQIEAPQSDIACGLVMHGVGTAVVDPFSAYNSAPNLTAVPFSPVVSFDLWLLTSDANDKSWLVNDFCDHITQALQSFKRGRCKIVKK